MKTIDVTSKQRNYKIIIKHNLLNSIEDYLDVNKFYVIIFDDNIPKDYINLISKKLKHKLLISFPEGEQSKSFTEYQRIIHILQENNVKRDSVIIALGGGVTGDLTGFIASTYLRGVDYIQIPTTLLSQIDSSVGGKVAINTKYAKNSVGCFYPPMMVLIDPRTLETLPLRHFNNGMAEMIKYGMIYSRDLFDKILDSNINDDLEYFIYTSLNIKKYYVEEDEFDNSLRQILNFGHTYGHAYEAFYDFKKYYHGEAVALGMVKVCSNPDTRNSLIKVLTKYNLPVRDDATDDDLIKYIKNDKKNKISYLNLIKVDEIGKAYIEEVLI